MLRQQAKILSILLATLDVLTVAGVHFYIATHFRTQDADDMFSTLFFGAIPCLFLVALYQAGAYRSFRVSPLWEEASLIAHAVLVGGACMLGISWFMPWYLPGRSELAVFLLLLFVALCGGRLCLRIALRLVRSRGLNVRYFLIIGDGLRAREIHQELASQSYWGIRVLGHLQTVPRHRSSSPDLDVLGELAELDRFTIT